MKEKMLSLESAKAVYTKKGLYEKGNKMNCQDKPYRISRAHNCGITLVALVVTIVILLILAGITLTYVFGDNGIIQLAKQAKNETEVGIQKEQDELKKFGKYVKR